MIISGKVVAIGYAAALLAALAIGIIVSRD